MPVFIRLTSVENGQEILVNTHHIRRAFRSVFHSPRGDIESTYVAMPQGNSNIYVTETLDEIEQKIRAATLIVVP